MALTTRKASTTIADIGLELMFRLHNEVVGIGYLCSLSNLLISSIVNTKRDIVAEGIIKQDGFLIHVAYQLTQIEDA